MEAGDPGDHDQDPGAGRGLTKEDLGHRPPTLLSGEEDGGETETAAETGAGAGAETRAWIGAETRAWIGAETRAWIAAETRAWIGARTRVEAGAGAAGQDPTLEVAESRDQRRGKTPGRDLYLGDPGPDPRGVGRMKDGCPSYYNSEVDCIVWAFSTLYFLYFPAFFL